MSSDPKRIEPPIDFAELRRKLEALPPETEEEKAARLSALRSSARLDRLARFKRVCPPEFAGRIDQGLLSNPEAFGRIRDWTGAFPGPIATGPTGRSKTRAAWSVLGRLIVEDGKTLAWFPVKRLLTEFARYENKDAADEFWRFYRNFDVLFVDDLDKINWQFASEMQALFQFFDWIYRDHRPCVTTTNKDRKWWADKMGDAFARRLFDEAHFEVRF